MRIFTYTRLAEPPLISVIVLMGKCGMMAQPDGCGRRGLQCCPKPAKERWGCGKM